LQRVGVASCGPFVRLARGLGVAAPNLCGGSGAINVPNDWRAIPLEAVLREQFSQVVIENDCVAALIGERTFGALQDVADCAYVTWSTGIGFGLCVDGRILRGKNGNAGHAGHMLLSEQAPAWCGCGNRGDLEALIAGRNLEQRYGVSARRIFNDAAAGDTARQALVREAASWLGRALYNLVTILDLRSFAIGGSVWSRHAALLAPLVQAEIDSRFAALTSGVTVQSAALGTLVADVGALSLVLPPAWCADWRRTQPWQRLAVPK
jgi:glucokinase